MPRAGGPPFSFSVVWALSHWVNKAIWTDACRFASLSNRAASIRAADAWLKLIDIDPPHLLARKAVHAVRMVVTEMRMTATSSRQSADDEGNATGRGELLLSVGSGVLSDTNSLSPLRDLLLGSLLYAQGAAPHRVHDLRRSVEVLIGHVRGPAPEVVVHDALTGGV